MNHIKQICAFKFNDHLDEAERQQLLDEMNAFPTKFPDMKNFLLSRNISKRDDRFSHAFVVEFETEEKLLAYLNSDTHETFVRERFRPNVQERGIITLTH